MQVTQLRSEPTCELVQVFSNTVPLCKYSQQACLGLGFLGESFHRSRDEFIKKSVKFRLQAAQLHQLLPRPCTYFSMYNVFFSIKGTLNVITSGLTRPQATSAETLSKLSSLQSSGFQTMLGPSWNKFGVWVFHQKCFTFYSKGGPQSLSEEDPIHNTHNHSSRCLSQVITPTERGYKEIYEVLAKLETTLKDEPL